MSTFRSILIVLLLVGVVACKKSYNESSDGKQRALQEQILKEATAQTGMPAIVNFRERKLLKEIYELRDQESLATYTYLISDYNAALVFFCDSIGYGIPYATQYTNPEKPAWDQHGNFTLPQADPNALFSPDAAEGTWVLCKDPKGPDVKVVYVEPRIVVSPFRLVDASPTPSKPSAEK